MDKTTFSKNRRDFFVKLILGGIATGMPLSFLSCGEEKPLFKGTGLVPFKIWEELLMALKESPDFHPAQIEKLIATKNPEAMFNYLRDSIVLVPASEDLSREGKNLHRGLESITRTGVASAREKSELLAKMYQQAGFEAEVVWEETDFTETTILGCYLRTYKNEFNPPISDKQFKQWKKELQLEDSEVSLNEDIDSQAQKLTENLFSKFSINEELIAKTKIKWANKQTPSVRFKINGEEKFAHLIDPEVPFGRLRSSNSPVLIAPKARENKTILKLELYGYHSRDVKQKIDFLSGEWNIKDVLGKQLNISFLKNLEIGELSLKSLNQVQFFTPSFSLQGVDAELSVLEENSYLGEPITQEGETIKLDDENGKSILTQLAYEKNITTDVVTSMSCKAKTGSFPRVKLAVTPKDSSGKMVEGLLPKSFLIKEDENLIPARLISNKQSPKILILSDGSLSMPAAYRGEGMETFNKMLESTIKAKYPSAIIEFWITPSALYSSLLKASQASADLILYATDGHNDDKLNDEDADLYAQGPPAFILDVNEEPWESFEIMAKLTGGKVLPAKDQELVLKEVFNFMDAMEIPPYILEYNSRSRAKHKVEVQLFETQIKAEDTYNFPDKNKNEAGLIALHLKMSIGRDVVTKSLAGFNVREYESLIYRKVKDVNYRKYKNEVRGFLHGGAQLYIETDGPTFAVAMSDVLKAQLTNRKWGEAFLEEKLEEAKTHFEKGTTKLSGTILSLLTQPKDMVTKRSLTHVKGYRLALAKTIWPIEEQFGSNSFDFFQTSKYTTIGGSPLVNFKNNAKITAQLAVRESQLFEESTLSLLAKLKLTSNQFLKLETESDSYKRIWDLVYKKGLRYKILDNKDYTVFNESLESLAFWKIDGKTGELYGMLPDGSGGGNTPIPIDPSLEDGVSILLNIVAILEKVVLIASAGRVAMLANPAAGVSLAIIAKYGVTLAKLYGIVTQTIVVMDATGMDDRIKKELQVLACEVYREIVFGMFGNAGAVFAGLESLIMMLSPNTKNPFSCT
ncbi:hypothetical protein ACFSQJ_18380 [Croceitalea marina]|uniref:VWFA domain-containing protein n=1 Tax=Croceitalea marina TaxID=1775166 RepID=A0ABW5N132_9FLAO